MLHLHPSDYRVMPWKDGGGSTTEIAIEPPGSSLTEPFLWRVRVDVQVLLLGPDATSLTLAPTSLLFSPSGWVHVDALESSLGPLDTLRLEGEGTKLGLRAPVRDTPLVVVGFWPAYSEAGSSPRTV